MSIYNHENCKYWISFFLSLIFIGSWGSKKKKKKVDTNKALKNWTQTE